MSKLIKKVTTTSAAAVLAATAIVPVAASAQDNVADTEITHAIFTTDSGALASIEMALYEQALIAGAIDASKVSHIQLGNGEVYPMELYEQALMTSSSPAEAAQLLIDQVDPVEEKVSEGKISEGEVIIEGEQPEQPSTGIKVESVKAINAKQVAVTFNKAIDKDSVIEATGVNAGTLVDNVFDFRSIENPVKTINANASKGTLSEDGKTLTITADSTNVFEGRYDVTIDGAKDKDGNAVEKYEVKNLDLGKDTTAPTIVGTEQVSSNQVKVKFSEPVQGGTITVKYADGTAITGFVAPTVVFGTDEVIFNLSAPTITENKNIVVTFNGVQDMNGNLISPQPATATIVKLPVDGVEPTVSTITQTGAKKFTIKFNKDLDGNLAATDVTVGGTPTTAVKKVSASEYEFTTATNLKGLQTVTVAAGKAKDLAGQTNTDALSKVVTFTEDTVAPKAIAQLTTDKNNKQVIELTFDKDVTAGNVSVAGKQVKDYVTTTVGATTVAAVHPDANNKKVLHIPLSAPALAVEDAAYDLTISSTAVKSDADKNMDDVKVQFTRGKDGQAENVNTHVVSNVAVLQGGDNNTVTATFTIPSGTSLDGATATNVANYVIDGAVVESVTLAAPTTAATTTQVATLKLKEDSNTFTGTRNITVKNVKVAGSTKVMDPKTINNVSLNENVRPTITKSEVTDITLGSATIPAVPAKVNITGEEASKVSGTANDASTTTTGATEYKVVDNSGTLELQKTSDNSIVIADLSSTTTFTQGAVTFTITGAADGDTFTVETTAEVPSVPSVPASSEVTLTFSEAVTKTGAAVDFELFIGGEKSTATVATTVASNTTTLTVKIDKALTAEDFSKGVELKAVSTLDIKDQVGNLLKVDGPIALTLN